MNGRIPKKEERATHTEVTAAGEGKRMPSREPGLPRIQPSQSGLEESMQKRKSKMTKKFGTKQIEGGGGSW